MLAVLVAVLPELVSSPELSALTEEVPAAELKVLSVSMIEQGWEDEMCEAIVVVVKFSWQKL